MNKRMFYSVGRNVAPCGVRSHRYRTDTVVANNTRPKDCSWS